MTQVKILKKRFIAGAVCPDCQIVDRIVVETGTQVEAHAEKPGAQTADKSGSTDQPELSRRRCVACGFADEFSIDNRVNSQGVPRGKPERAKPNPTQPASSAQPVRILDPGKHPKR
ncbi:MAG: YheV family putative metal-binding protein [Pseudomonadaceae bacterium]|nr:YheV family putative metal-binding protein [Pseudomonadaceae bacterium]